MIYRREIDGLRAVAVMPVILFHAGFGLFSGGYVGVDVFFVISGYLITSILISDLERGDFSVLRFYERRARRILPALFVVMAACIPMAWFLMLPNRFQDFSQSLMATVFFGSNILFWREFGYFAPEGREKPLLHTWSLSVEEQYYLLFPLVLWGLWRFGRHRVFWLVVGMAAISLAISEWGWRHAPTANFFLSPTRAWELLAGSICAFLMTGQTMRPSNLLGSLGLALIGGAVFVYDEQTPFPSVYGLVPVVGTMLIVLFAGASTLVGRVLSQPVFVGIGLISYSAYLWHQPLFAFARLAGPTAPGGWQMAGLCALTLGLAWGTWAFVERPFRRRNTPVLATRGRVFLASGIAGAALFAVGLAGHVTNGFDARLTDKARSLMQYAAYPFEQIYRAEQCMLMTHQTFADFDPGCWQQARSFMIGDSHAAALASGLPADAKIAQLTQASCPPALDFPVFRLASCEGVNAFRFDTLLKAKADVVYIHADWVQYWTRKGFQAQFDQTLARIAAAGPRIVVIGSVPKFYPNLPERLLKSQTPLAVGARVATDLGDLRRMNADLRQMAQRHGAQFWDPIEALCTGDACLAVVALQPNDAAYLDVALIAFDHGHLTRSGAVLVARQLMAAHNP